MNDKDLLDELSNQINLNDEIDEFSKTRELQRIIDEEELIKAYVGPKYDFFDNKYLNIFGLLCGTFYLFYRKMFLIGILIFVIIFILGTLKGIFFYFSINIILFLIFNKFYLYYVRRKVKKIKLNNLNKDLPSLKKICEKEGGVSFSFVFLGILGEIAIVIIMTIFMFFLKINTPLSHFFTKIFEENKMYVYEGKIQFDSNIKIGEEFSFAVPNKFKATNYNKNYYYNYEYGSGNSGKCRVSFGKIKGNISNKKLLNQIKKYYQNNIVSDIKEEQVNNLAWDWLIFENNNSSTNIYTTSKKGDVYFLEYIIEKNAPKDCDNYKNQILNSINEK